MHRSKHAISVLICDFDRLAHSVLVAVALSQAYTVSGGLFLASLSCVLLSDFSDPAPDLSNVSTDVKGRLILLFSLRHFTNHVVMNVRFHRFLFYFLLFEH